MVHHRGDSTARPVTTPKRLYSARMAVTPAALPASAPPDATIAPPYTEIARAFDVFATQEERWRKRNRTYHGLLERVARFHVPPGQRVLEIGCGSGDLLAALEPSVGVGVDISAGMVEAARERHPELRFVHSAGEALDPARPSTTSSSPTSSRSSTTCRRSSRTSRATRTRALASSSTRTAAWRPSSPARSCSG